MTRERGPIFTHPPQETQPQPKKRGRPRIYTDEERAQRVRERSRRYYHANPERQAEWNRNYREANPEKVAAKDRRYRKKYPEKVAEIQRRYYLEVTKSKRAMKYLIDYTKIFPNPTDNEDIYS